MTADKENKMQSGLTPEAMAEALKRKEEESELEFGRATEPKNSDEIPTEIPVEEPQRNLGYRVDREQLRRDMEIDSVNSKIGWYEINPEYFPSGGIFYPSGFEIKIQSADVPLIRHFSTLDENNPYEVDDALNDLMVKCCLVRVNGTAASYKDILEEDRIHVILEIKRLTFPKGENKLGFKAVCNDCSTENEILVENSSFQHRDLDPKIKKYYDIDKKLFNVRSKSFGNISIKPPTIGIMQKISRYIKQKQANKEKIDKSFVKILPYMITDWKGLNDKVLQEYSYKFHKFSDKEFSLMFRLADMAKVAVKEEMRTQCSNCSAEVTAPITFPGGIKALFVISDITDELL